jgi:hypothetical protein
VWVWVWVWVCVRVGGGGGCDGYRTNSRVSAFSMPMYPDRNMSAITDDLASYRVARGTATHCTGLHGRELCCVMRVACLTSQRDACGMAAHLRRPST